MTELNLELSLPDELTPDQLKTYCYGIFGPNRFLAYGGRSLDRARDRKWEIENEYPEFRGVEMEIAVIKWEDLNYSKLVFDHQSVK